jgi:phosphoribosylformylglycinamidine synthase subunit PurQ / glutaminase
MKFGVVIFPGSNCDRDMLESLEHDMKQEVVPVWHKDETLAGFSSDDCIVLPGGFSFGDYLRCGAMASLSPIMKSVIEFAHNGGKVLGVCNGFQILCESGLLPGALLRNREQKFVCKNTYIKNAKGEVFKIPIAHGEGRYFAPAEELKSLTENGQVLYTYCDEQGNVGEQWNPNGAINHIAGIRNAAGNVFGMMPHPERATSEALKNTDGRKVFKELFQLSLVSEGV